MGPHDRLCRGRQRGHDGAQLAEAEQVSYSTGRRPSTPPDGLPCGCSMTGRGVACSGFESAASRASRPAATGRREGHEERGNRSAARRMAVKIFCCTLSSAARLQCQMFVDDGLEMMCFLLWNYGSTLEKVFALLFLMLRLGHWVALA